MTVLLTLWGMVVWLLFGMDRAIAELQMWRDAQLRREADIERQRAEAGRQRERLIAEIELLTEQYISKIDGRDPARYAARHRSAPLGRAALRVQQSMGRTSGSAPTTQWPSRSGRRGYLR